jgi:geranylgeranyl diphosphate synthase type II
MNVLEGLRDKKAAVDAELARLLAGDGSGLYEVMRYAVLGGGKRYRPLLLLSTGEAFGAGRDVLLPYACAVELIHSYSLIHDDLPSMDNDDVRRGQPSCHKAYGEGPALLAGDGLLSLAFEVLSRTPRVPGDSERKDAAIQDIAAAAGVEGMIKGQWMDIRPVRDAMGEKVFLDMIERKTGALILASVRVGAILAGAPASGLAAATRYGTAVGFGFQIRDDLADAGESGSSAEPNAVAVFGLAGARARLDQYITDALRALGDAKVASDELRFLAETLRPGGGQ